ncbi:hypothetical protein VNO80_17857 [Phaseolus coccineus]|uniref:Uncharacterized protein n=1 Tax=Phaseolus coccineus TaxID=3886 RepID=A0AAN9MD34_PHACN
MLCCLSIILNQTKTLPYPYLVVCVPSSSNATSLLSSPSLPFPSLPCMPSLIEPVLVHARHATPPTS